MQVGSLVVCTMNFILRPDDLPETVCPEKDIQYVVRSLDSDGKQEGICLQEIVNKPQLYANGVFSEIHFWTGGFREIQPPMSIDIESLIQHPHECH